MLKLSRIDDSTETGTVDWTFGLPGSPKNNTLLTAYFGDPSQDFFLISGMTATSYIFFASLIADNVPVHIPTYNTAYYVSDTYLNSCLLLALNVNNPDDTSGIFYELFTGNSHLA